MIPHFAAHDWRPGDRFESGGDDGGAAGIPVPACPDDTAGVVGGPDDIGLGGSDNGRATVPVQGWHDESGGLVGAGWAQDDGVVLGP